MAPAQARHTPHPRAVRQLNSPAHPLLGLRGLVLAFGLRLALGRDAGAGSGAVAAWVGGGAVAPGAPVGGGADAGGLGAVFSWMTCRIWSSFWSTWALAFLRPLLLMLIASVRSVQPFWMPCE